MAGELKITTLVRYEKSGVFLPLGSANQSVDVSGSQFVHHMQSIGTSEEALDLGEVTTGGWFWAKNRDGTNFVEIRSGTGATDLVKLKAGEECLLRMSGDSSAPFAIADTGACLLEYVFFPA